MITRFIFRPCDSQDSLYHGPLAIQPYRFSCGTVAGRAVVPSLSATMKTENERFWSNVIRVENGCWEWQAALSDGYGMFSQTGRKTILAHRWLFQYCFGAIAKAFQLHHRCENRRCVNPFHLQALTQPEHIRISIKHPATNNSLKTHCQNGHEFNEANTRIYKGKRQCRACANMWQKAHNRKGAIANQ